MERLQKALAKAGIASRRGAEELIRQGRISVGGQVVTTLGTQVDPSRDAIAVDGKPLSFRQDSSGIYLMLNKPKGYLTSRRDPHYAKTVYDLLPEKFQHLHYIGRLDKDSEGLLIFTDDGDLTYHLTHPRHEVSKRYQVTIAGELNPKDIEQLERGVMIEDRKTAPTSVTIMRSSRTDSLLEIAIHEGRKRQVRRMLEAVGRRVLRLQRTHIGSVALGSLKPGEYRLLSNAEVESLKEGGDHGGQQPGSI